MNRHFWCISIIIAAMLLLAGCGGGSPAGTAGDTLADNTLNGQGDGLGSAVNPVGGQPGAAIPGSQVPVAGSGDANLKLEISEGTATAAENGIFPLGDGVLPPNFNDPTPEDGVTLDLIAGQHNLVGHAYFYADEEYFYLTAWTIDDWTMGMMHLYIGNTPPNKGNPGSFPYHYGEWNPAIDYYEIEPIPLSELGLEYKSEAYVALHFEVSNDETAWMGIWDEEEGEGNWDYAWSKKWGGYMGVCLPPVPALPDEAQEFSADRFGTYSYWDVVFANQGLDLPPGEFFIGDVKNYVGWCVDRSKSMEELYPYLAQLYSSYDPNLPANPLIPLTENGNLEFVNFMINERRDPAEDGPFFGVDWTIEDNYVAFQNAVWYFTNGFMPEPSTLAENLAAYALMYGDNYIPCEGGWYGIVLYPVPNPLNPEEEPQMIIIEVDP